MLYRVVVNVILRVSVWKNPEELPVELPVEPARATCWPL